MPMRTWIVFEVAATMHPSMHNVTDAKYTAYDSSVSVSELKLADIHAYLSTLDFTSRAPNQGNCALRQNIQGECKTQLTL